MKRYLLDTGVLVHYPRQSPLYKEIEAKENLLAPDCIPLISVVVYGEILSFGMQNNWGQGKLQSITSLLAKLIIIDINSGDAALLKAYAEIDAFSKGKLPGRPLGTSAIKMEKTIFGSQQQQRLQMPL
ncbi:MAG TPA: hypothetical protein VGS79_09345 [Puia sp.]|nr:hypothetical protein [Puia sp.]